MQLLILWVWGGTSRSAVLIGVSVMLQLQVLQTLISRGKVISKMLSSCEKATIQIGPQPKQDREAFRELRIELLKPGLSKKEGKH